MCIRDRDNFTVVGTIDSILRSNLFYSEYSYGRKIKSPIELAIGLMRSFRINTKLPDLHRSLREVGQAVFYPPNVKGWEGGRIWINSSTLLGRSNLVHAMVTSESTTFNGDDLQTMLAKSKLQTPQQIIDRIEQTLFAVPIGDDVKQQILTSQNGLDTVQQFTNILHQLATLPQFQLN